jgi:predicted ATPase/DNA-binding SARP family transcriptional activator
MRDLLRAPARLVASPVIRVKLFGAPQLHIDDQPVALPRRQMRALLYRLAVAAQPVPREQLCFLLWPDAPEAAARRYLTVLLNQLRQHLPQPEALLARHDAILLDPAAVEADTVALARALGAGAAALTIEGLRAAADLYDGPFLHGFSLPASPEFDAWADQERQVWERRYLDALALLVDGYAAQGAFAPAIEIAQRALAVDELSEDVHRRLIELYAAGGDRSRALRQFERCVIVLERELGVSPLPETRAVYEAVRDGRFAPRRPEGAPPRFVSAAPETAAAPAPAERLLKLPAPLASLLGRADELAQAGAALLDPEVRLLTLWGAGGSGKTRLAEQIAWDVADRFADGAVFVSLAALRDPALVMQAIAAHCDLKQASAAALGAFLRDRRMLLVLDNCEHLLEALPEVATLLRAAPQLRILATSRTALNLQGEHTLFVPPLPLPDLARLPPHDELASIPSVALLLMRTRALNPRFQLTAENAAELAAICVRLDGLPLALELAAARLKLLAPRDMLRRLERRLSTLTAGPRDLPDRQQTLRATIDWSYRLLDSDEQLWLERCSVFVGGWTLDAAESLHERLRWPGDAMAQPLDAMAALVDKSLVQVTTAADGAPRFRMLETIREFAAERLSERGAFAVAAQAHADAMLQLVEPWDVNQATWLASIEGELGNLRAALRWCLDREGALDSGLRLGLVMARFFYWRDWISEGRQWLEQLVAQSGGRRTPQRVDIVNWAALLASVAGDGPRSVELHELALGLARELGLLKPQANALIGMGTLAARQGDYASAIASFEESLAVARRLGDPISLSNACYMLANVLVDEGREIDRAAMHYEECLAIVREHKMKVVESMTLAALGALAVFRGDTTRAEQLLPGALELQREMGATMALGWTLTYLGILRFQQARYRDAARYLVESLETAPQGGAQYIVPVALEGVAGACSAQGLPEQGARLLGAGEAMRESLGLKRPPIEQGLYERILAAVRAGCSAGQLAAAWAAGRGLSPEQAIAEAKAAMG